MIIIFVVFPTHKNHLVSEEIDLSTGVVWISIIVIYMWDYVRVR